MNRKISGILAGSVGAFLFGAVLLVHAQDAPPPPPPPEAELNAPPLWEPSTELEQIDVQQQQQQQ